jgi:tetratricopeptide (TPR) repeat protein
MSKQLTYAGVLLHNKLYDEAYNLVKDFILVGNGPFHNTYPKTALENAIHLLIQSLEINPDNYSAMFMLGKIYQRMENYNNAISWFEKAYSIKPTLVDIGREASLSALSSGDNDKAIYFAEATLKTEPNNASLLSNYALILFVSGKIDEAKLKIQKALDLDPTDPITLNVHKEIFLNQSF